MIEGRKLYPNDSELLVLLSNSYIGTGKIEVAIGAFEVKWKKYQAINIIDIIMASFI